MKPRPIYKLARLFFCLGLLAVLFSSCHGGTSRPESNGEGILGRNLLATKDNSRIRCFYETVAPKTYVVSCFTVIFDALGEVRAQGYDSKLAARWAKLAQLAGPEAEVSCVDAPDLLSTTCDVRTPGPLPTTYLAELELRDIGTGSTTNLKAEITVPFTAELLGRVPHLPELLPASASAAGEEGRAVRGNEPAESEPLGIRTNRLPLQGLNLGFQVMHLEGSDVYLSEGGGASHIYRLDMKDPGNIALTTYAGTAPSSPTQNATPIVPLNSNRLRLQVNEVSHILPTALGPVIVQNELGHQKLIFLPDAGGPTTLVENADLPGYNGSLQKIVKAPDEAFIIVDYTRAYHVSKQGVRVMAGIGAYPPPGHVETAEASSLVLNIVSVAVSPAGDLLILDGGGVAVRALFVTKDGKYQTLDVDLQGVENASVAINTAGEGLILITALGVTRLYRFEGSVKKETIDLSSPGRRFPNEGSASTMATFPFHHQGMRIGAADAHGFYLLSDRGLSYANLTTGVVEMIVRTTPTRPKGFTGEGAKSSFYDRMTGVSYLPDGRFVALAGKNILTFNPAEDKVESVALTGANLNGTWFSLLTAPSGARFIYTRGTLPKLYRVSESGAMTLVMSFPPAWYMITLVAKSDTELYAHTGLEVARVDLSSGVITSLLEMPYEFRTVSFPLAMSLGPDNALYLLRYGSMARVFPLDETAALKHLLDGEAELAEGGFAHEMHLPATTAVQPSLEAFGGGIVFSDQANVSYLRFVGTAADGSPVMTYHRLHPTSATPNPDCAANSVRRISNESNREFQSTLNAFCPGYVSGLAARSVAGVAQFILARDFGRYGNLFLLGLPLN